MNNTNQNPNNDEQEVLRLIFNDESSEKQTAVIKHEFKDIEAHASESTLGRLRSYGDALEQMSWNIGWETDRLYKELEANGAKKNYMLVCYYVSINCLRGQRSHNTVKKWALTARFFPKEVAEEYNYDLLPFNHFTYAASFGDTKDKHGIEYWRQVLNYSIQKYEESGIGIPCSVPDLKERFEGEAPKPKTGKIEYTPFTPSPGTAAEVDDVDVLDRDDEEQVVTSFLNALQVINAGLPVISRKFPGTGKVLSGISIQLSTVIDKLRSRKDVDE